MAEEVRNTIFTLLILGFILGPGIAEFVGEKFLKFDYERARRLHTQVQIFFGVVLVLAFAIGVWSN